MFSITQKGNFNRTENYLRNLKIGKVQAILAKYGERGVQALSAATPRDSGVTAGSWSYTVEAKPGYCSIRWHNSHEEGGFPVAVMLQYGHGTGTGGYVPGRDYINPVMRPIFEEIANEAWKEVTSVG